MSIDLSSALTEVFLQSIPLMGKIFTAPFILCISLPAIIGGKLFGKEGSALGGFLGLVLASSFGFIG
ncbi:hypothetical protein ABC255_08805 [Neobacillus sp. 3P2-tot-E-2]|uniref:hypothetical protein n=1 Tax=Neobacillus sp. 3P2-tot-E-2 TaxID=3132212 RepID=UPI0039A01598